MGIKPKGMGLRNIWSKEPQRSKEPAPGINVKSDIRPLHPRTYYGIEKIWILVLNIKWLSAEIIL